MSTIEISVLVPLMKIITDIVRNEVKSYKQLPIIYYQIQTKFRDEIRPRFGVMRAKRISYERRVSFHENESFKSNLRYYV